MHHQSEQSTQEARRLQKACAREWEVFAHLRKKHREDMARLLAMYQVHEERRMNGLKESLRKMCVYSSSALANMQYDCQTLAGTFEAINPAKDVAAFAQANYRLAPPGNHSTPPYHPVLSLALPCDAHGGCLSL